MNIHGKDTNLRPGVSGSHYSPEYLPILSFLSPSPPSTKGERFAVTAVLIISGALLLVLIVYYILNPRSVIGDAFVNTSSGTPAELPPPGSFPFYVKPVTLFFVATVAFSYTFFALVQKPVLQKLPKGVLSIFLIASVILFAMCVYEVFFNFTLWSSLLVTKTPNPDQAVNIYPVNTVQVNLVYATKSFVALLFVTFFAICAVKNSIESANT